MSNSIIDQLEKAGRLKEAAIALEQLLVQDSYNTDAIDLLFQTQLKIGNKTAALHAINHYLKINPESAESWMNKGNLLHELNNDTEALECFQNSIKLDSTNSLAYSNQSNSLLALDMLNEALASCDTAIRLDRKNRDGWMNKANILFKMSHLDEAEKCARVAVALSPNTPEPLVNLGRVLNAKNQDIQAISFYKKSLLISPKFSQALINLGYTYSRLGKTDLAVNAYESAAQNNPALSPGALWNIGLIYLSLGKFVKGWDLYESRWDMEDFQAQKIHSSSPRLRNLKTIESKKILVFAEQGLGDSIQFCRYLEKLENLGAEVIFHVQKPLLKLFKNLKGVSKLITIESTLPFHDFQVPLLSLPGIFETTLLSIPKCKSYLTAEQSRIEYWKNKFFQDDYFNIGISWQGSHGTEIDRGRSFKVSLFEAISQIPNVRLISLQKGYGTEQLQNLPREMKVLELGDELDADGAFLDTAAVMSNLDLVISSDTAIAHLAGALGVKTWVALKFVPDWRWMLDRSDSPWYPSMTLFRQEVAGEWNPVFNKIKQDLSKEIQNK